jgi:hypothetical protein
MILNLFKQNLKPPKLGRWKVGENMSGKRYEFDPLLPFCM